MEQKITFARSGGAFNFTEGNLRAATGALFARSSEPRLPQSLIQEATDALLTEAHGIASARGCDFLSAAKLAVRARPALFKLTRCEAVHDDAGADASIEQ